MSYYRTINGKQYDRELLEIVEKAAKRSKAPLGKNVARTLFEAIVDGNEYTDVEKRTVKYIRDTFKFTEESDEYLRTEIRKWAAKISVPSSKKKPTKKTEPVKKNPRNTRAKKEESFFSDSYSDGDEYEYNSPTPEYNELIELNKFRPTPKSNPLKRILIFILIGLALALLLFFGIRSCNRDKTNSQGKIEDSKQNKQTVTSEEPESKNRSLERVSIDGGNASVKFDSAKQAIRYINDLNIRFLKQTMETEVGASDKVATLALALKSYPQIKIRVKGHTCFIGELDENKILSEERANFIKDELIKNGVSPSQVDARGFGETTSIGSNYTEAGRIMNRRVDFTVLSVQ
ncbi:MAG: OmpA family protein [Leptospira sp.]|nr:OmpA family protein [Leptospira sp.]